MDKCREAVTKTLDGGRGNPPYYAPPLFRHGSLLISQTSTIFMYLGNKLQLSGSKEDDAWQINALALTALDGLSNEAHDSQHPIGIDMEYEDYKDEGVRYSREWIKNRLPKRLEYWEKVLKREGPWLLGEQYTHAV
jgi:glutathione S-transferase